ncbi:MULTISPECIES: poly-beta-1,6-N-acetyl-D-glucosamine biosynthesis protein PgaD [Acinetobacter]|uniref:poly-beta-1,6-N-acetyl-D-glucosamine biosynthesis protein PgaD n=1 Tax=Acinetobacter TaxID=469 RepID=UPI001020EC12|nr:MULTISPECIES: poly-beta-1,6-N-acetyl-D-glucosamine biosynthesis protein PgaD [Acinetobacter]MDM1756670.1 poly-beta-1,6-N-acetyl-D-glucosamine biosynthesis protein PgaD [Acinetobacter sp. 256-1]MDM1759596.1 poly-beta-1,6-N-acetyl-D-glucosamine biosynthesis protein PgaD [Acinetobacter sp. 251-1]RYL28397.1 poly-beta-1,6-N-acetyl-D-glucosamine biosynthesis protein PgaD [Acinetobacter piscicola]
MSDFQSNIITDESKLDIPEYIDQPHYVKNKAMHYTLQMMGWMLWTLLLLPLVTAILWVYQVKLIKNYIFAEQIYVQLYNFAWLALIVMLCCASLLLWASYNWLRYRKTKDPKVLNVTQSTLAEDFLISTDELSKIQKSKSIVLHYDDEGVLSDYELKKA